MRRPWILLKGGGSIVRAALLLGGLAAAVTGNAAARQVATSPLPDGTGSGLTASPVRPLDEWRRATDPLVLELSDVPPPDARGLAVLVGALDVTAFTRFEQNRIYYDPVLPLPAGETELAVHLVREDGEWLEIARYPLRVLNRAGLERSELEARLEVNGEGLVALGSSPQPASPGSTYQHGAFNSGVRGVFGRGRSSLQVQGDALGVTTAERALRYGQDPQQAPRFDLSSYRIDLRQGPLTAALGHVSFGDNRHLASGMSSRGATAALQVGGRAGLSFAVLNGSSIVGWNNLVGLGQPRHRLGAANLGLDLLPRPLGSARLDLTALSGSRLPLGAVNRGLIDDAEESRGASAQLLVSDPGQRLRVHAGYAVSRFHNPHDPWLAGGLDDLVPVQPATRAARFADANLSVLRGVRLLGVSVSAAAAFRHEEVEPLFRSLGSYARADYRQNSVDLTLELGPVTSRFSHTRGNDNLDELRSVLQSVTRSNTAALALPVAGLLRGASAAPWLPSVSYGLNRVHQFGAFVPEDGGFSAGHVPDQLNTVHNLGLDWYGAHWRLGLRADRSLQDNRQTGREEADFAARTYAIAIGATPWHMLGLNLDASEERADNREHSDISRTRRLGLGIDLRLTAATTISGGGSLTRMSAAAGQRSGRGDEQRLELAQAFPTAGGRRGRFYVRYTRQSTSTLDRVFAIDDARTDWRMHSGLTLSVF
jgi:hypothetical protein